MLLGFTANWHIYATLPSLWVLKGKLCGSGRATRTHREPSLIRDPSHGALHSAPRPTPSLNLWITPRCSMKIATSINISSPLLLLSKHALCVHGAAVIVNVLAERLSGCCSALRRWSSRFHPPHSPDCMLNECHGIFLQFGSLPQPLPSSALTTVSAHCCVVTLFFPCFTFFGFIAAH